MQPVVGVWFVFGAAGVATWIAYIGDPAPRSLPTLDAATLDKFAQAIADEHDESR